MAEDVTWTAAQLDTDHILQFFQYGHLPPKLQDVSRPFAKMAEYIVGNIERNPERTVALRKLLESKDAAVRAFISGVKVAQIK